jgi:hypothetical protein
MARSGTAVNVKANIAASQTDATLVAAKPGFKVRVVAAALIAGGTATDVTLNGRPSTDEVQSLTIDAAGGTYTITYSGQTTAAIAWNASAAAVQSALEALSNLAPGDIVVTGANGGPYTITFGGTLADTNVAQMTTDAALLTGGAGTAVVATVTGGAVGVAISPVLALPIRGTLVLPLNEHGWFETGSGEGLSVTTGAGSTTGIAISYSLIPAY